MSPPSHAARSPLATILACGPMTLPLACAGLLIALPLAPIDTDVIVVGAPLMTASCWRLFLPPDDAGFGPLAEVA